MRGRPFTSALSDVPSLLVLLGWSPLLLTLTGALSTKAEPGGWGLIRVPGGGACSPGGRSLAPSGVLASPLPVEQPVMGEQRPLEALSGGAEAVLPAGEPHPLGPWQVPCAPGSLGSLRSPLPGQTSPTHNSPTPSRWKTQRTTQEGQLWEGTICVATLPPQAMGGIKEPRGAVSAERLEGGAQGAPPPWPGPLSSSASSPTAQVTGSSGFGDIAPVEPRALFFTMGPRQCCGTQRHHPSVFLSFLQGPGHNPG